MSSTINALTSGGGGIAVGGDSSGQIALQKDGTTYATGNQYGIGLGTAVPSSGIGITFPATQSASTDANTLDDYEEGTFTPTKQAGMTTTGTVTLSGVYVKVGQMVTFQCTVNATTIAVTGGSLFLSGLPFSVNGGGGGLSIGGYSNQSNTLSRQMYIGGPNLYCIGSSSSGDTDLYISGTFRCQA